MLRVAMLILVAALAFGCTKSRALMAVKNGSISLQTSEQEVMRAAGKPDLILARELVETLYYKRGDLTVSVSLLGGKVIAFDDSDKWPAAAAAAADDASDPVSLGEIRVGMTEAQVRELLDDPDGITAKNGQESLHWLSGDDVDSIVHIKDGKVIGYWDRPTSEYTQNVPSSGDRSDATTGGKIRVGMSKADVQRLLGEPDSVAGKKGLITNRYESDPVFGDEIIYSVDYQDDQVVNLYELNVTRDEDEKEEEEAKRLAAEAEARGDEAESSIFGFLSNPLVQAALGAATAAATGGSPVKAISDRTSSSKASRTLEINGRTFTGGPALGQPCGPGKGCPSGYSCYVVAGDSGACVQ